MRIDESLIKTFSFKQGDFSADKVTGNFNGLSCGRTCVEKFKWKDLTFKKSVLMYYELSTLGGALPLLRRRIWQGEAWNSSSV